MDAPECQPPITPSATVIFQAFPMHEKCPLFVNNNLYKIPFFYNLILDPDLFHIVESF